MTGEPQRYLIFRQSGRIMALELSQVAEVAELTEIWPIPLAPACYPGAMNFHGTIVAVMDLARFFGLPSDSPPEKTIIIDTAIASLALRVEQVLRIVLLSPADVAPPPDEPFAAGVLHLPEGEALLLDAAAIAVRAGETINI